MYHIFVHSSVDGHLVSFHILTIITNMAMNTGERGGIYVVGLVFLFFSGHVVRTRIVESWDVLYIIGDWNVKVGSQEIPGVTGKFGFGVQNKVGQRPTVLPRECTGQSKGPLPTKQQMTLHTDIT